MHLYSFPGFLDFSIDTAAQHPIQNKTLIINAILFWIGCAAMDIESASYTFFKVSKNRGNEYILGSSNCNCGFFSTFGSR